MKYLIIKQSLVDPSQFVESDDQRLVFKELYELHNFCCIKISDNLFGIFNKIWNGKFIEIPEKQAELGSSLFSEIREVAKVWEGRSQGYGEKLTIEMTPEITSVVLDFMKIFAKEIIEDEFEKRFLRLRNTNQLEATSWEIQKHEAREWILYQGSEGHVTPFLDYLAEQRSINKTELSNKILSKSELYEDNLSTMLVDMQKIIDEFKSCTSIWDINILYEDYLGVIMPTKQAINLGRTVSETDWERKPEYEVKSNEFNF
jgi:hypothetical protein